MRNALDLFLNVYLLNEFLRARAHTHQYKIFLHLQAAKANSTKANM